MLSPLRARANNLETCARRLSFNCTRYLASTSDVNGRQSGRPPKSAEVPPKSAADPPLPLTAHRGAFDGQSPLALSLSHYFSLPSLPPIDQWVSHFPYGPLVVRDRVSIRDPASAIRVAQSFISSKKTLTGKPKVIIEAFPGAWLLGTLIALFLLNLGPGALSRAFLTLPPSQLKRLIILEDHKPYLEYLLVCFASFSVSTLLRYSLLATCPCRPPRTSCASEWPHLGHVFLLVRKRRPRC